MLGWDVTDIIGQRSLEFIHPDDQERAINLWMECLTQPGYTCRSRLRHKHLDGRWIWLEMANHNLLDDPDAGYVECEMFDISEEMEAHESVRASEELLRRLAGALPVGVAQFDLSRHILYANERLYEIVGAGTDAEEDSLLAGVLDAETVEQAMGAVCEGHDIDIEIFIDRVNGGRRRCTLTMRALTNVDGAVVGGVLCLADVTDAARMRSELEQRATFDLLTGCVNRPTVMTALSTMLAVPVAAADGHPGGIAVVFVDLDDFKAVNDQFGHAVGDTLLSAVAARLREVVRGHDVVGRFGGDEFLVICPEVDDAAAALTLGERVVAAIASPLTMGPVRLTPRASVGVAWTSYRGDIDAQGLITEADAAMYAAKHAQDGRPVVADSRHATTADASGRLSTRLAAEATSVRLRQAFVDRDLRVHFQPVVDIATGASIGCEALLRWRRDGQIVPAAEFLATAEATALICDIGPWVIDDVCSQAAATRRNDLTWFVNLSPRELAAPRTIAAFERAIDHHGISPSALVVEVTEHGLLTDDGAAHRTITDLERLGVGIALDDFGTGWSSLSTLLSVPVRWLKIDRRFTVAARTDRGAAIVAGIVRLAEGLGARTVAEGIETEDERAAIRALGVHYAQGYLFARPQPLADLGLRIGLDAEEPNPVRARPS
jgi:diguanylate cyclase (GGDEF)-like protein/PAS domain S-box-containing protein